MSGRPVFRYDRERFPRVLLFLAAWLLTLAGCGDGSSTSKPLLSRDGTVRFVPLEGGFYGIQGDDSVRYEPASLSSGFQQEGLRVHFIAKAVSGPGVHQWGMPVEIVSISKL